MVPATPALMIVGLLTVRRKEAGDGRSGGVTEGRRRRALDALREHRQGWL
jgi:hypothetical protein